MKKVFNILFAFICLIFFSGCTTSEKTETAPDSNILVTYFSASPDHNTKKVAEKIAHATGGQLHEIVPAQTYTEADLNWRDENSRSSMEKDRACRPEVKDAVTDMAGVDIVYLGYPNWWGVQPMIVNTFIDANLDALKNKIIIPFSTSGGSGIEESVALLRETYPDLDFRNARLLNDADDEVINSWVTGNPSSK
ncbi:MAG: NAD(P)H-dependent oxidoreductase [Muribaculaceae bacterium]|nr:NAD(P)H-dependent oxidoreductase [Muribaculaceae bacterium]